MLGAASSTCFRDHIIRLRGECRVAVKVTHRRLAAATAVVEPKQQTNPFSALRVKSRRTSRTESLKRFVKYYTIKMEGRSPSSRSEITENSVEASPYPLEALTRAFMTSYDRQAADNQNKSDVMLNYGILRSTLISILYTDAWFPV